MINYEDLVFNDFVTIDRASHQVIDGGRAAYHFDCYGGNKPNAPYPDGRIIRNEEGGIFCETCLDKLTPEAILIVRWEN